MNRIREIREAKRISLKELAQKTNLMTTYLQRLENYGWKRSQTGMETDERIAAALGEPLWEVFPEVYESPYPRPKKPEPQPREDTRTPEQIDEELRMLNENLRNRGAINDEWTRCEYTESQEGVFEGIGSFEVWQQLQKQKK